MATGDESETGESLRVGIGHIYDPSPMQLRFVKQLGVDDVLITSYEHEGFDSYLPRGQPWTIEELVILRNRVEEYDLNLFGIETIPIPIYDILIDKGDTDDQISTIKKTIRNVGEAGIDVLGYSGHPPSGVCRTIQDKRIRGGAITSGFDYNEVKNEKSALDRRYTEDELWENYQTFLSEVIPVAEKHGVNLALHNSEPPVDSIAEMPLLFRSVDTIQKSLSLVPSDNHTLKFDAGGFSEMGEDVAEVIRKFGKDRISYVHLRDVVGTVPQFYETFLNDEQSNQDEVAILRALDEVGFTGIVTPDHAPTVVGDESWHVGGYRARAHAIGYLQGLLRSMQGN